MKIEVKESSVFQPFELKLVIETEEELCDLWHRINVCSDAIKNESDSLKHGANNNGTKLWEELNELVTKYNLKDEKTNF